MSPEERELLQGVFDRMRNNASGQRDADADRMIADQVRQQPYAPYYLTQTVIVQEQALQAANQRIQQLEQQHQGSSGQSGGFLSSLFGGGSRPNVPAQAAPPPVWNQGQGAQGQGYPNQGYPGGGGFAPQQQGGPWGGAPQQGGGGGFLHGALQTAAGVAGGALLFDGIRGLMGGHSSPFGIGAGTPGGFGGGETVVNNYYGDGGDAGGGSSADWQQDANQDADFNQDMSDYGVDDSSDV